MKTSYPAQHSTPGPSLTTVIPTIVIHYASPQIPPQLLPRAHALEDGSVSRSYGDYPYAVVNAKVSVQNANGGRPRPSPRQPHGQTNLYCLLVAWKPGWGAASSKASFEARVFAPSETDWRTRTCGSSWHSSTRAGRDSRSVASPLHFKDELPQPMLTAVKSVMDEEERLVRLLAVILKERSPMYVILCEEIREARLERLRREDREARQLLGNLIRDLELEWRMSS